MKALGSKARRLLKLIIAVITPVDIFVDIEEPPETHPRKMMLMLILVLLGFAFIYISPFGFLVTIGIGILIGIVVYDHYRAQKEWEQKHTKR